MEEFLGNMFSSDYFGLFFGLILILSGGIYILSYHKLWRVIKGRRLPSGRDMKRINNISKSIYHSHTFEDTYDMVKHKHDKAWWDEYKKRQTEKSQFPGATIQIRMLAGGALIFAGIFILGIRLL